MGIHKTVTTKRCVVCDKCGKREDNTREDLLPPNWAKLFIEEAPDKYPTNDFLLPINYKWDQIIKMVYDIVLCEMCYKDYKYLFMREFAK